MIVGQAGGPGQGQHADGRIVTSGNAVLVGEVQRKPSTVFQLRRPTWVRGALPARTWIRTDRIVTLNASQVVKAVGRVSDKILTTAVERFCAGISGPT